MVEHEQRHRSTCATCGVIAYENPRLLVSTIVAWDEQILLCLRAHPPAEGRWGLPGGFMECGETLEEAAARETWEETGVRLSPRDLQLHTLATLPELSEVYVGFVAEVQTPELVCGSECREVRFFDEASVPWSHLTYPDVEHYLRRYFEERRSGTSAIHFSRLDASGVDSLTYQIAAMERTQRRRGT